MVMYPYIEEYIEVISGWRDILGKQNFWAHKPIIKMSAFDEQFCTSLGEQLSGSVAMTDRQFVTAMRVIGSYAHQLASHSIAQPDHRNCRLGIRTLDRQSSLTLVNNKILFKFPYNENLIQTVKTFAKTSQGSCHYNSDTRVWEFGLTEYNLSWAVAMAQAHNIEVDAMCLELFDEIVKVEQEPFKIELEYKDGQLSISNAPTSMTEYIEQTIGFDDIYTLVDMSGALGYTVSEDIRSLMTSELGDSFVNLCVEQCCTVPNDLANVIEWAIAVNRLPICLYAPNFSKPRLGCLTNYFAESEIMAISVSDKLDMPFEVPDGIKLVYTAQVIPQWAKRLPLLISNVNLMHGTTKRALKDAPEKIIYHCPALPGR